eukprot:m.1506125 g.1506125  ORF g.1506125 m.1506125 type:complete len:124 (+) comp25209_c0_seq72:57-428(+)
MSLPESLGGCTTTHPVGQAQMDTTALILCVKCVVCEYVCRVCEVCVWCVGMRVCLCLLHGGGVSKRERGGDDERNHVRCVRVGRIQTEICHPQLWFPPVLLAVAFHYLLEYIELLGGQIHVAT